MKVKIDFITNSSSESFAIVLIDTVSTMVATGALTVIAEAVKESLTGVVNEANYEAQIIADAVNKEAEMQSEVLMGGYDEAEKILENESLKIKSELEQIKKQWEESDKTADKNDPEYEKLKSQYEEYMKYLENELAKKEYEKYVIHVEKAEKQAEIESKNERVRLKQVDYISVKEEQALLEATLKGYKDKGYDVNDIEERLKQLKEKEKEITDELNALIDYKPRDRGEIGPGAEFDKIINEYKKKKEEIQIAKMFADEAKRKELSEKMARAEEELQQALKSASRWDLATKAVEGIQFGADIAIEGLSHVTGPAGKQIKLIYKAGKSIAGSMGEGMADPTNAGKHLAKGIIGAASEIAKDKFGENPFKSAIFNTLNEGAQGALDAAIENKDILTGGLKGLGKGVIDSAVDAGLDFVKSKIPIPKGSSIDVHDFSISKILNNNPLSKGLAKTIIREGLVDKTKDIVKGGIVDNSTNALGIGNDE